MTIRPGASWGQEVPTPSGLVVADTDAEFVRLASGPGEPTRASGGRRSRSHRSEPLADQPARDTMLELPIDLMEVSSDIGDFTACAHVVARPPSEPRRMVGRPVVAVMNAQFIGRWDVAPRGHPNDGRAEVFEADAGLSIRDRLAVRRRLPLGTHIPHPRIRTRSVREATFEFASPMALWVDGCSVGRVRSHDRARASGRRRRVHLTSEHPRSAGAVRSRAARGWHRRMSGRGCVRPRVVHLRGG